MRLRHLLGLLLLLLCACSSDPPPLQPGPQPPPSPPSPPTGPGHSAVREGRIELDGEPFFPHGFYYVSWEESPEQMLATLGTLADAGFNTVHASLSAMNDFPGFLDEAERRGMKVIVEGEVQGASCVQDLVRSLGAKRALLGWNIGDDVHSSTTPEQLRARQQSCKAADPNHFTYFTVYDPSAWGPYLSAGDLVGPYNYPVPGGPLRQVDRVMELAGQSGRPLLGIPQTFNYVGRRSPTPAELRNMAYQALANRAVGLLHYNFNEHGQPLPQLHPDLWAEAVSLVPEVRRLTPALTRGSFTKLASGADFVVAASWRLTQAPGDELYVVVLNTHASQPRSVSFALPASGEAQPLFVGRPFGLRFRDGRLQGSVGPLEVHVYQLAASP